MMKWKGKWGIGMRTEGGRMVGSKGINARKEVHLIYAYEDYRVSSYPQAQTR